MRSTGPLASAAAEVPHRAFIFELTLASSGVPNEQACLHEAADGIGGTNAAMRQTADTIGGFVWSPDHPPDPRLPRLALAWRSAQTADTV